MGTYGVTTQNPLMTERQTLATELDEQAGIKNDELNSRHTETTV